MRALALTLALALPAASPAPAGQDPAPIKPWRVGFPVREEIVLRDLDGRERLLFEEHEDAILVLVWWSLKDPTCRTYEKRLAALQEELRDQEVVILLVESNRDELVSPVRDPLERIRKHVERAKLTLPILLDEGNRVADDFEALCANHAFVIDRLRRVRYAGGIDDDPRAKKEPEKTVHWLGDAVRAVVAGEVVEVPLTRPKGRKLSREPREPEPGR